jgi:tRNA pseudouridine55 synthase|tara:strand:- start:19344 stop:20030 length:687 start_codon:yes stop_codon:yes gene_type:complete
MITKIEQTSKIILVNKPLDWTSFDVVKKIRGLIKKKYNIPKIKVGHAGTLDPKASGLLVICTGSKTKMMKLFEVLDKKYVGVIKIGCSTDSFDSETKEKNKKTYTNISLVDIKNVFQQFIGEQIQTPPIYSAIKVAGERVYKKARRGEINIELKPRKIYIKKLSIKSINLPYIEFEVECSKGTYIRSLANDIGKKLLCGAYLFSLKRTQVGDFKLSKAVEMDKIINSL